VWCHAMYFLTPLGRLKEALIEMQQAVAMDPLDPLYNTLLGYLLYGDRQFEQAAAQLRHTIELDPMFFQAHWFLSLVYAYEGRLDEALAVSERANELSSGNAVTVGNLGRAYGLAGRTDQARRLLEDLTARRRSTYVPASAFVFVHAGLGERDEALKWLATGVEEHDPIVMGSLRVSPSYDALRSHPRYRAIVHGMNVEA